MTDTPPLKPRWLTIIGNIITVTVVILFALIILNFFQNKAEDQHILDTGVGTTVHPTGEIHDRQTGGRYSIRTVYVLKYEFYISGHRYTAYGERQYETKEQAQQALQHIQQGEYTVQVKYLPRTPHENIILIDTEPPK